jgi:Tol biopolymer transport system component
MKHTIVSLAALGCVALAVSAGVSADSNMRPELDVAFGPWSPPVNLGPVVNSTVADAGPAISKDGLSLYFQSVRSGQLDLWVSRRAAIGLPWESPVNLGPALNSDVPDHAPNLSRNGHYLFFGSFRTGDHDIYVSRRRHTHDDFAWEAPVALPFPVNGRSFDVAPDYFENPHGRPQLYFSSDRANGFGAPGLDIYMTELTKSGTWSDPLFVAELNSGFQDDRTAIRSDGLEIIFGSSRNGNQDLYVSQRNHVSEPWSTPENLGTTVNSPAADIMPALSATGRTLYFASSRPGGIGGNDLYVSTRARLRPVN